MWNDIAVLEKLARYVPYVFIIAGFLIALSGQFVRTTIDSRIKLIRTEIENTFKRTPPNVDVLIAKSASSGDLLVVLDAKNLIPFKARWSIVTKNNEVVSGIMLEDQEIHPTEKDRRFSIKAQINEKKVIDEFVEIRLRYESIFFSEVGNLEELKGKITRQYRLRDGEVYDW